MQQADRAVTAPFEQFTDLGRLSDAGAEIEVKADADALKRLADWFEVESVEKFEGIVTLRKFAPDRYRYEAVLTCDLTQHSVVSLEPVRGKFKETFHRDLHVAPRFRRTAEAEAPVVFAAGDEDVPEELDSPRFDLAGPLLEELSLALDPYPRAPGEAFDLPEEPGDKPESPFAVLKRLKDSG